MSITTQHPEYIEKFPQWRQVRDCVKGEYYVKLQRTIYLPQPNVQDTSAENLARYEQYHTRANYLNVTGRTRQGLVGAIFRRPPFTEIPKEIEYMYLDCNGAGQSIEQFAKWLCGELLETGRAGILVDFPEAPENVSLEQAKQLDLRPGIAGYKAEDIINWRYMTVGGRALLNLIVLKEQEEIGDNYSHDTEDRYRVLRLDENGHYIQTLHKEDGREIARYEPKQANGQPFYEIPFVITGAEDNSPGVDDVPLYDLSCVNIAHYRNSADYEEGVFIHSQGTLFIDPGKMSPQMFQEANPKGVLVGSRAGHILGEGGKAYLLQMEPNNAALVAMQEKEKQMISIGARLITATTSTQTAEEARINASGESSALSNLTGNASDAIERSLLFAYQFSSAAEKAPEIHFILNQDFFDQRIDPQTRMAKMQELDRGLIAKKDYRDWLRKSGDIQGERSDDEIDADVEITGGF